MTDAPADFSLEEDGPRYVGPDTAALAWRLGPPGSPAAHGIDIFTIRDGRVSVLHTLIAGRNECMISHGCPGRGRSRPRQATAGGRQRSFMPAVIAVGLEKAGDDGLAILAELSRAKIDM